MLTRAPVLEGAPDNMRWQVGMEHQPGWPWAGSDYLGPLLICKNPVPFNLQTS